MSNYQSYRIQDISVNLSIYVHGPQIIHYDFGDPLRFTLDNMMLTFVALTKMSWMDYHELWYRQTFGAFIITLVIL